MIFPRIRQATNKRFSLDNYSVSVANDYMGIISRALEISDVALTKKANIFLKAVLTTDEELSFVDETLRHSEEKYKIETVFDGKNVVINIYFSYEKGLWHGANTVAEMLKKNCFFEGIMTDYPLFAVRGYIEGFYGRPWKHSQRLEMLKLMSHNHMNTYFYAPKNDPYHREKWRELYPEKQFDEIKELVSFTKDLYIDLNFCVAPGLNICYSREEDVDFLVKKLLQLYSAGIKNFGILLDDISPELNYDEDRKKFKYLSDAHTYLVNRVYEKISNIHNDIKITVCPFVYHGKGDEEYICNLGKGLDKYIDIFWTGNNICSEKLTSDEALYFEKNTFHKPLYWDNYPVNDAEMFNEMHLGPVSNRDKTLYLHSAGLISNTMEYFECSKVALMTIADYLWNPVSYDSDVSWRNALSYITEGNEDKFIYFADHLKTSCLKQNCSEIMFEYLSKASFYRSLGQYSEVQNILCEYNKKLDLCVEYLGSCSSDFIKELKRWTEKFLLCCEIMKDLENLYGGNDKIKSEIERKMKEYNYNSTVLTEFCFREFVEIALE